MTIFEVWGKFVCFQNAALVFIKSLHAILEREIIFPSQEQFSPSHSSDTVFGIQGRQAGMHHVSGFCALLTGHTWNNTWVSGELNKFRFWKQCIHIGLKLKFYLIMVVLPTQTWRTNVFPQYFQYLSIFCPPNHRSAGLWLLLYFR